ncbi:hypothetical protein [Methylobacterium frigidaeris]|uniref:Uncharacterized protein n=1 Tax=Methylobacterium frigidaeris TaxID=2038277 RepID=A0AA37H749_9HYPH|nr:hypothetical protein [Methylobacterium frigidaeris]PIK70415.1 hypothetical protein CS379_24735 [Methylobacterium frigidaeris]GJD60569.1 hypothetical protein MPEAHAMD_0708 [Methylobacterium frigidaeris]
MSAHASRHRRGLSRHRPRPAPLSDRSALRPCDVVLALTGLALLGTGAIWAAIMLGSAALAP